MGKFSGIPVTVGSYAAGWGVAGSFKDRLRQKEQEQARHQAKRGAKLKAKAKGAAR